MGPFTYKINTSDCDLLDLDKDPCVSNINIRYLKGQAGIYSVQDVDPDLLDLCLKVHGEYKPPFTRKWHNFDYQKCFLKFSKPDRSTLE